MASLIVMFLYSPKRGNVECLYQFLCISGEHHAPECRTLGQEAAYDDGNYRGH
jgi:hypothetical protein